MSDFDEVYDDEPSKSQRKRDADAYTQLGKLLCSKTSKQLQQLTLGEVLMDCIITTQKTTAQIALKRQYAFLGKLIRNLSELELQRLQTLATSNVTKTDQALYWRDQLLAEPNKQLELLCIEHQINRQFVRQLLRKYSKDGNVQKNASIAKKLLHYLRDELA